MSPSSLSLDWKTKIAPEGKLWEKAYPWSGTLDHIRSPSRPEDMVYWVGYCRILLNKSLVGLNINIYLLDNQIHIPPTVLLNDDAILRQFSSWKHIKISKRILTFNNSSLPHPCSTCTFLLVLSCKRGFTTCQQFQAPPPKDSTRI